MNTAAETKPAKPTGKAPYLDRGWWAVDMDNGRCLAFETRRDAEKFLKEAR